MSRSSKLKIEGELTTKKTYYLEYVGDSDSSFMAEKGTDEA